MPSGPSQITSCVCHKMKNYEKQQQSKTILKIQVQQQNTNKELLSNRPKIKITEGLKHIKIQQNYNVQAGNRQNGFTPTTVHFLMSVRSMIWAVVL